MKQLHHQVQQRKSQEKPINYSCIKIEQRDKLENKSSNLDLRIVEGYGVIWGSKNDYSEIFIRGAFSKSIQELGPLSNSSYKLKLRDEHGRACALFETIEEDEIGLYFKTKPLDKVQWCDDLLVQLRSESINNFSIGFRHCWDKVEWENSTDTMINYEAKLIEISSVSIPSDMKTYAVRSIKKEDAGDEIESFIKTLPKEKRLDARILFTRCLSLIENEQSEIEIRTLKDKKPVVEGIDYNYLINNLNI